MRDTGAAPDDGWGVLARPLADLTPEGFRRYMKAQMCLPGRSYAELGEAMGVDRDEARALVGGSRRLLLHQALAALRYFRAAERRSWPTLRRCPFCGNRNTLELIGEAVECPPCGAAAPLAVWNRADAGAAA